MCWPRIPTSWWSPPAESRTPNSSPRERNWSPTAGMCSAARSRRRAACCSSTTTAGTRAWMPQRCWPEPASKSNSSLRRGSLAPDVGGVNYPGYFKVFAEHDVRVTLNERVTAVRRKDGRLEVDLYNEYAHATRQRIVDQVVVEHGTLPRTSCTSRWCRARRISARSTNRPCSTCGHSRCSAIRTAAISCSASEMRSPAETFTRRFSTRTGCAWRCNSLTDINTRPTFTTNQRGLRMPQQVRGVIARSKGAPVELVDIIIPDPGPGEVVVESRHAACATPT